MNNIIKISNKKIIYYLLFLMFLCLLTIPQIVLAATYYLAPSGNDDSGNGTQDNPWFSLNKAWGVIGAGDTLYLKGGVYLYDSKQRLSGKNGEADNMIKIWSAPGEQPIISPGPNFTETRGIEIFGNNIHVKGLEITGFTQKTSRSFYYGITAENSNNNIFENLKVHDNGFGLSIGMDSGGNLVLNSDFYRNSDPITNIDGNEAWGGADGLTFRTNNTNKTNTVRGSRMWWNSDDGIDLFGNEGTVIIENSWSFWNGYRPGTFITAGDGSGFKLGSTSENSSSLRRVLRNNIAFENRTKGFDQNNARVITHLYNNTSYNNANLGSAARSFDFWNGSAASIVKNNLSFKHSLSPLFNKQAQLSNNTFQIDGETNNRYNVSSDDFISLDTSEALNPRQADGSLPNINFLKLHKGSDLVDAGENVGLNYNGSAPDIGAFESNFGDGQTPPNIPNTPSPPSPPSSPSPSPSSPSGPAPTTPTPNNPTPNVPINPQVGPGKQQEIRNFIENEKKLLVKDNRNLSRSLSGRLLLQVEGKGEAWYVNPTNKLRYYLGNPEMAFEVMKDLGIGISNDNLEKIRIADQNIGGGSDRDKDGLSDIIEDAIGSNKNRIDSDGDGINDKTEILKASDPMGRGETTIDLALTRRMSGKILLQVQSHGEAWYANPVTNTRYYLGRPADAYSLMRLLALGITNRDLRTISIGD